MHGILRPCRKHLGPELHQRWRSHLCGTCLTLRDVAGQAERCLTGYDVLLLSVLVEAQAGPQPMREAGRCPLRGMQTATVVDSSSSGTRLAAAAAMLSGSAGLADKVADDDLPRAADRPARRIGERLKRRGTTLAQQLGLDAGPTLAAPARAAALERSGARLDELLDPSGDAVASLFAQTTVSAGCPDNAPALRAAGDAFGRLVHLLDAVEDWAADAEAGRFNPLRATGTHCDEARAVAGRLHEQITAALAEAAFVDGALVEGLFGGEFARSIRRSFPALPAAEPLVAAPAVPQQRSGSATGATGLVAAGLATWALASAGVFGGGWVGRRRGGFGGGYGPGYGYGPGPGYGYGPRRGYRRGPSCCDLLACNCCANLACNGCCDCCGSGIGGGDF